MMTQDVSLIDVFLPTRNIIHQLFQVLVKVIKLIGTKTLLIPVLGRGHMSMTLHRE